MKLKKPTRQIKIIPEFISGSSTQAVTKQQASKTLKRVQGLSNFTTARGFTLIEQVGQALPDNAPAKGHLAAFTLIELLVVILIIGILAAVAVPQYQKAVDKTKTIAIIHTLRAIKDAQEVYYLAHGVYATSFYDLDINLPAGELTSNTNTNIQYKDGSQYIFYIKNNETQSIKGYPTGFDQKISLEFYLEHHAASDDRPNGSYLECTGRDERTYKICAAFPGQLVSDVTETSSSKRYILTL